MRKASLLIFTLVAGMNCIKLDFFLFDSSPAQSIEKTYHGLPLYSGTNSPPWVTSAPVEREIYITPEGDLIDPGELQAHNEYIHGCFLPAPEVITADTCPLFGQNITFLYTHGNSGDMLKYWYRAVSLWSLGANVFIFTYRGYGLSHGEASRVHIKQDAEAAAAYVKSRSDVDTGKIIIYGYSMGGVTASYLAGASSFKNTFSGVILESALDEPEQAVSLSTGIKFPNGLLLDKETFSGVQFIQGTTIPILHMHGSKDERVLIEQAHRYYEILKRRSDYTHYVGKSEKPDEQWIKEAHHRNIPNAAFTAEMHISDYRDDSENPSHCCVNPFEFDEQQFQCFLKEIGNTNGAEMVRMAEAYRQLVASWVLEVVR